MSGNDVSSNLLEAKKSHMRDLLDRHSTAKVLNVTPLIPYDQTTNILLKPPQKENNIILVQSHFTNCSSLIY